MNSEPDAVTQVAAVASDDEAARGTAAGAHGPFELRSFDAAVADLYLDPNNPRYSELNIDAEVPDGRITEVGVQAAAMARMFDDRFAVAELKESIRSIGFLHLDRLAVVALPEEGRYRVIEGNRRLAAVKSLLDDEDAGALTLPPSIRQTLLRLPVALIESSDKQERDYVARVFQGVRHLASVRAWGAYEQAALVARMLEEGRSVVEIRKVLGLGGTRVGQLRRVYYAIAQMRHDTDFGDAAKPSLFSQFDEALKSATMRQWFEWDDERALVLNSERRSLLYGWIVGAEVDGTKHPPKVVDARDFRRLPELIGNPGHFQEFLDDPELTLVKAAERIRKPEPEYDWRGALQETLNVLSRVPAIALSKGQPGDSALIAEVIRSAETLATYARLAETPPAS
jgi:hypothetical protein